MTEVIVLPAMTDPQEQAWLTLLDLYEQIPSDWTIVGGQMVLIWCAERGATMPRPTDDADAVLDVRTNTEILLQFTSALSARGYDPVTGSSGVQHRWKNGDAVVDVLIPRHLGPKSANRRGAGGGRTIETPGAQKVLNRSEAVRVQIGERQGTVPRPSLLGAIVGKSAAYTVQLDRNRDRHLGDLTLLASMLRPSDVDGHPPLDKRELRLVSNALGSARAKPGARRHVDDGEDGLDRLAGIVRATQRARELGNKSPETDAVAVRPGWGSARWGQPGGVDAKSRVSPN